MINWDQTKVQLEDKNDARSPFKHHRQTQYRKWHQRTLCHWVWSFKVNTPIPESRSFSLWLCDPFLYFYVLYFEQHGSTVKDSNDHLHLPSRVPTARPNWAKLEFFCLYSLVLNHLTKWLQILTFTVLWNGLFCRSPTCPVKPVRPGHGSNWSFMSSDSFWISICSAGPPGFF